MLSHGSARHRRRTGRSGRRRGVRVPPGRGCGRHTKVTMEDLVVSGDRVVGRFVYRGTHAGNLLGIPASGRSVEMRSIDIWRVHDGMFVEHWDELNLMQMFQQIGVLPPLDGLEARS
ncbi:ester cyclase [Streptomyces sp. NPDC059629]|uniref:ester cyclase n=1 Tax=Streptomyces sp. NPDC059629 TaxID=3346889 RepID=UPI0036A9787A